MLKYRKIPAEVEAICFTGESAYDLMLKKWGERFERCTMFYPATNLLILLRKQGSLSVTLTDWVIQQNGLFYRCSDGVFRNNYEPIFDQPMETPEK